MAIAAPGKPKVERVFVAIAAVLAAIAVGAWAWAADEALLPGSPVRTLRGLLGGSRPPGAIVERATLVDPTPAACRVRRRGSKGKISLAGDVHDAPSLRLDDGRVLRLRPDVLLALGREDAVFTSVPLTQPVQALAARAPLGTSNFRLHDVTCLPPGSAATVVACAGADGALGPCPGLDVVLLTPEAPALYFRERRDGATSAVTLGGLFGLLAALSLYASRASDRAFFFSLAGRRPGLPAAASIAAGLLAIVTTFIGLSVGPLVSMAGVSALHGLALVGLSLRLRLLAASRAVLTRTRTSLLREAGRAPGEDPLVELAVRVAPDAELFEVPSHGRVAFARLTLTEVRKRGGRGSIEDYLVATRAPDLLVEDGSGRGVIGMAGAAPDGAAIVRSSVGPAEADALAACFRVGPERTRPESPQASAAIEVLRPGDALLVYARRTGSARVAGAGDDYRGPAEVARFQPISPEAVVVADEDALLRELAFDLRALWVTLGAGVVLAAVTGAALWWLATGP